jgi:hypothetical protein
LPLQLQSPKAQFQNKVENLHEEVEFAKSKIFPKEMKTLASATKGKGNGHRYRQSVFGMTLFHPFCF